MQQLLDQVERRFEQIIGNSAALESFSNRRSRLRPQIRPSSSKAKPAREKSSSHVPFTMPDSASDTH